MTHRIHVAFIASIGLVALMLPKNETSARPGAAPHAAFTPGHPVFHRPFAPGFRHRGRNNFGAFFWPGYGDDYGPSYGTPLEAVPQAMPSDVHYSYTYDVPWDWVHRYPPNVTPSDKPYVSSCPEETVKVPGRDGTERTVSIMRCY